MTGSVPRRCVHFGLFFATLMAAGPSQAHPLGLSSVNRYLGVRPHGGEVEVDYLLDLAEMPAYAEIESLDADHDSAVTPAERDRYLDGVLTRVLRTLRVVVDGQPVALREVFRSLEAPAGQNGLSTLRVVFELRGPLLHPDAPRITVHAHDELYAGRGGWRELAGLGSPQWALVSSSLPAGDPRAGQSLAYPAGPIAEMPRQDDADFTFQRAGSGSQPHVTALRQGARPSSEAEGARLIGLLRDTRGGWSFWLFALGLAFSLGAGHALSPGHGKTLVGAWLVGSRASVRHALILGVTVTVTHTASVFFLGLVALTIERTLGSEKLLRALEFTSGALVVGIALSQLPERWRRLRRATAGSIRFTVIKHTRHAMVELRSPGGLAHHHGDGRVHSHELPETVSLRSLVTLGVSGGMVPCPGALVVLLAAIAMHRIAAGLALLVAFSLGLAFVLSALGALFVTARRLLDRVPTEGRLARALPVFSSLVVTALGAGIIARSLWP